MLTPVTLLLTESQLTRFQEVHRAITKQGNYQAEIEITITTAAIEGIDKIESIFLKKAKGVLKNA